MGIRRQARECALQILYPLDMAGPSAAADDVDAAVANFFANFDAPDRARERAEQVVRGVLQHKAEIDELIAKHSPRWKLDRMALVDRNVLRLCVHELLFDKETPARVVIDEGVEIARRFGAEQSAAFVNGVLDAVAKSVGRLDPKAPAGAATVEADEKGDA